MHPISYHNHSSWSDGTASIREMALAAKAAGLSEFGISDHLVVAPRGFYQDSRRWSMGVNLLERYCQEALEVAREVECPTFHMRLGIEADFFPETWEKVSELLSRLPLDYVIGAVHYVDGFPVDASAEYWNRLSPEEQGRIWLRYGELVTQCARLFPCQWLAHLDLPKLFRAFPPPEAVERLADLLQEGGPRGLCIEINTAGGDKPCRQFYPSPELLRVAVQSGVGLLASADGHAVSQVARHFQDIPALFARLGVTRTPRFQKRQLFWHSLDATAPREG
ncbi:MAG: histidinol-phosphatase [Oligosphaeraceae bacterium]